MDFNEPIIQSIMRMIQQNAGKQTGFPAHERTQAPPNMIPNNPSFSDFDFNKPISQSISENIRGNAGSKPNFPGYGYSNQQPSQQETFVVPTKTAQKKPTWQEKLDMYKTNKDAAVAEVIRAKKVWDEEEKLYGSGFASTKRAKEIHEWANKVRKSANLTQEELSAAGTLLESKDYQKQMVGAYDRRIRTMEE